jgi:3-hydroxyisobutyrate dehydrogenase
MSILRASALYAPTFDKKLGAMQSRDYSHPNFPLRLLRKDVGLVRDAVAASGLDCGLLDAVQAIIDRACAFGHGDDDYAALFEGVFAK